MTYIINKSNGQTLTTLQDRTIDTTTTSLSLVGRSALNYGAAEVSNVVHLLENFASASAPLNPLVGQVWYDSASFLLKLWNGTTWASVRSVSSGRSGFISIEGLTTPPNVPPYVGATYLVPANATGIWSGYQNQLAQWNGTNYDIISPPLGHQVVNQTSASIYDAGHYLEKSTGGAWIPGIPLASQSGQWTYAVDFGVSTNPQIALNPAPLAFNAGMRITIKMAHDAGPITALTINGTYNFPIVRKGANLIVGGEWNANDIIPFVFDGTNFVVDTYTPIDVTTVYTNNFAINTQITKTVYGAGADFADLNAAFTWLSQKKIGANGYVTLLVSAGQWLCTGTVDLSHPDGARIAVIGASLKAAVPTPSTFAVSGLTSSAQASDTTAWITLLRQTIYASELLFSGTGTIKCAGGLNMSNLLISGSNAGPTTNKTVLTNVYPDYNSVDGLSLQDGIYKLTNITVFNFWSRNFVLTNCSCNTYQSFLSINGGIQNISVNNASILSSYGHMGALAGGSNSTLVQYGVVPSSVIAYQQSQINVAGVAGTAAQFYVGGSRSAYAAVNLNGSASNSAGIVNISNNNGSAVAAQTASSVYYGGQFIANNNTGTAIYASDGSRIALLGAAATSSTINGAAGAYYAANQSMITRTNVTVQNITSTVSSPSISSTGNTFSAVI